MQSQARNVSSSRNADLSLHDIVSFSFPLLLYHYQSLCMLSLLSKASSSLSILLLFILYKKLHMLTSFTIPLSPFPFLFLPSSFLIHIDSLLRKMPFYDTFVHLMIDFLFSEFLVLDTSGNLIYKPTFSIGVVFLIESTIYFQSILYLFHTF